MVSYNVELNIKQDGAVDTGIKVTQGDFGEVQLLIRVKDDDSYIMDAVGAEIVFNLPNGYIVTGNATISAGTYTYVFKGNELQSAGKIAAVLTLSFSDGRVSSCGFIFNCRYNPLYDRRIPAGSYITELEAIKEQAQAQVNYLNALIDAVQRSFEGTALTRNDLSVAKDETIAGIHAADAVTIKEIYDKFQGYLPMTSLINNALATVPGVAALDATMGKTLQDQITLLNSNLTKKVNSDDIALTDVKSKFTGSTNCTVEKAFKQGNIIQLYVTIKNISSGWTEFSLTTTYSIVSTAPGKIHKASSSDSATELTCSFNGAKVIVLSTNAVANGVNVQFDLMIN